MLDRLLRKHRYFLRWLQQFGISESEAEDILQSSYLKIISPASDSVFSVESTYAWFKSVLKNALIDQKREQVRKFKFDTDYSRFYFNENENVEKFSAPKNQELICNCALTLLSKLNRDDEAVVRQVELEDKSIRAIASESGQSENALYVRLSRAKTRLKSAVWACCRLNRYRQFINCDCNCC